MSCSGSHLGIPINIENTISIKKPKYVEVYQMDIPEKFGFNCSSDFSKEAF